MSEAYKTFAATAKAHRRALRMSLRKFSLFIGWDAANVSKIERGLLPPPRGERLAAYAQALGLAEGTDEWREFCDLAAAAKGEFPEDLRDEELLRQLPVLFRGMRGDPPSDEQCARIVELLRAHTTKASTEGEAEKGDSP